MAQVISPLGSFVQFTETDLQHCNFGTVRATLPVYNDDDVAFQYFIRGTVEEMDELSTFGSTAVTIGLVSASDELFEPVLIEFTEQPERFRIADTEILYNWPHGFPGFKDVINVGDCFRIELMVNVSGEDTSYWSNRFERIGDDCFTSVVEYSSDDNGFGFNYCNSPTTGTGGEGEPPTNPPPTSDLCTPTTITFSNMSSISIPYTQGMIDLYGNLPTVQVWIYDENGDLIRPEVEIKMDGYPPALISVDLGGNASGKLIIR